MKCCDICGSILQKNVIYLSMKDSEHPMGYYPMPSLSGEMWRERKDDMLKKLLFDIIICSNCAKLIPGMLNEVKRKVLIERL